MGILAAHKKKGKEGIRGKPKSDWEFGTDIIRGVLPLDGKKLKVLTMSDSVRQKRFFRSFSQKQTTPLVLFVSQFYFVAHIRCTDKI